MAAEVLFSIMSKRDEPVRLDDGRALRFDRELSRRIAVSSVSDEEMEAFFARHR